MKKNEDYESLVKEKEQTQSSYDATAERIANCEALLKRLKPIKEMLVEQKANFDTTRKNTDNLLDEKRKWKGSNYDTYIKKGGWLSDENLSFRDDSLDFVLDSLNDRITEIENQITDEYGLLGKLASALNTLANKIENFFN